MRTLDELNRRQDELMRLNRELEDTNRGVVALYAELDERADHLRRADELKSRFLSNMTHEFRTPVNSILALSRFRRMPHRAKILTMTPTVKSTIPTRTNTMTPIATRRARSSGVETRSRSQ